MTVEEYVHIVFDESNLKLQDIFKNSADEEDSSDLLQRSSQLIQKFNRLNLSDEEPTTDAAG